MARELSQVVGEVHRCSGLAWCEGKWAEEDFAGRWARELTALFMHDRELTDAADMRALFLFLIDRTRTRTNTNPNGTEANAAGRSVRACDARKSKS